MEPCIGCGKMSKTHPLVGVALDKETGEMVAWPVCSLCHRDPTHRKTKLKVHFFPVAMKDIAVAMAGKGDIG